MSNFQNVTRCLAAILATGVFAEAHKAKASDPVTINASLSIVSGAIGIFGDKTNPQAQEISAVLAHVRAINSRTR